ncbi:MAG: 4Fe-4S binding protein [Clostridiales Family XIII bacterium]|jgi:NAD-dependent dihydropyrimidine dehydrogenase PreA subunit|nr:4Fe-4S binding protein [Clostridiales Family XIII bacterium]
MIRKIIEIDASKCDGCGLCASACHEGAIGIVDGKAKLLRDDYCDGLGNCLPVCPTGAITFVEREAAAYDEAAVAANAAASALPCGCPGSSVRTIAGGPAGAAAPGAPAPSALRQWPVQIKLVPASAPFLKGADLLIAADCTAFACGGFHESFLKGKALLVGCPKLDEVDYSEKLADVFAGSGIRSVTVVRMEVPCCAIDRAVAAALEKAGKDIPLEVVTLSVAGEVL